MRLLGVSSSRERVDKPITFSEEEERKFSETAERPRQARERLEEFRRLRVADEPRRQT
jgi:hypothetical protein